MWITNGGLPAESGRRPVVRIGPADGPGLGGDDRDHPRTPIVAGMVRMTRAVVAGPVPVGGWIAPGANPRRLVAMPGKVHDPILTRGVSPMGVHIAGPAVRMNEVVMPRLHALLCCVAGCPQEPLCCTPG